MSGPDPRRRLRRRGIVGLAVAGALLGSTAAGAPTGLAQEAPVEQTGDELFGGYELSSRASGVRFTYDIPGLLPISPIFEVTVPEALATLSTGPSGFARSSVAFPGPLVADLGTVLALADEDGHAPEVPSYPLRAEAFFPSGPTEAEEGGGGGPSMVASTERSRTLAVAAWADAGDNPVLSIGSIRSSSLAAIEGGHAVNRARAELSDVQILGGVITIESVVTDLVAANDSHGAATDGGTTVSGVRFLGLRATLDERGLVLAEVPNDDDGPIPGDVLGQLGQLGPVSDALDQVTDPVNDALRQVLDQAVPQLDDLLAEAGVGIRVLDVTEQIGPGSAVRNAGGVVIDFTYAGREQELLGELVRSLPPEMRQSLGPIPNPVNFLVENHVGAIAFGDATVSSMASPLFEVDIPPFTPPAVPAPGPAPQPSPQVGDPGFSTPAPQVPSPATSPDRSPSGSVDLAGDPAAALRSVGLPAALVVLVAMASFLFGPASSRLADAVLAPTAGRCPDGLDRPPSPAPRE